MIKSLIVIDQVMRTTVSLLTTELTFHLCNVEAVKSVWTNCNILHYSLSYCPVLRVCYMPMCFRYIFFQLYVVNSLLAEKKVTVYM